MPTAAPSSRPVWSGSISFGLVTIPVKLFLAVREKRLSFRSLHDQDKVPLKQKLVCPADGKEVHREHIVKGYEIEKDQYVVVQESELEAVMPKATRAIEIEDFVSLDEDRKSTRLNSSHEWISYAVFCLKKKKKTK